MFAEELKKLYEEYYSTLSIEELGMQIPDGMNMPPLKTIQKLCCDSAYAVWYPEDMVILAQSSESLILNDEEVHPLVRRIIELAKQYSYVELATDPSPYTRQLAIYGKQAE